MNSWIQLAVFGLLILASPLAQACPSLEGDYLCKGAGQSQEISIQQDLRNDTWTYYLNLGNDNLTVITDGKQRELGDMGRVQNAKYTASCQSKVLKVKASGSVNIAGRSFNAQTDMDFTPTSEGSIRSTTKLKINGRVAPPVKMNCREL